VKGRKKIRINWLEPGKKGKKTADRKPGKSRRRRKTIKEGKFIVTRKGVGGGKIKEGLRRAKGGATCRILGAH